MGPVATEYEAMLPMIAHAPNSSGSNCLVTMIIKANPASMLPMATTNPSSPE